MTTIVYSHKDKQIACDSRETSNGFINSDNTIKYIENDRGLWFVAGYSSDVPTFIAEAEHNKLASEHVEAYGLLVESEQKVYLVSIADGVYKFDLLHCDEGVGSGGRFALSALDFGKNVKEAVHYAALRDSLTGGTIHVYDVVSGEFVDQLEE